MARLTERVLKLLVQWTNFLSVACFVPFVCFLLDDEVVFLWNSLFSTACVAFFQGIVKNKWCDPNPGTLGRPSAGRLLVYLFQSVSLPYRVCFLGVLCIWLGFLVQEVVRMIVVGSLFPSWIALLMYAILLLGTLGKTMRTVTRARKWVGETMV